MMLLNQFGVYYKVLGKFGCVTEVLGGETKMVTWLYPCMMLSRSHKVEYLKGTLFGRAIYLPRLTVIG